MNYQDEVFKCLSEETKRDINLDLDLSKDLGLDSLGMFSIVLCLKCKTDKDIRLDRVSGLKTVKDLVLLINKY